MKRKYPSTYKGKYRALTGAEMTLVSEIDDMFAALGAKCPGFDIQTPSERPFFEYYNKESHYPYMPMYRSMLWEYKKMNSPKDLTLEQRKIIELIAYHFMVENKLTRG